tara:strand:- start:289 stop:1086 length:798 start_codon:yes stop_codon:yes gene_type:complete
MATTLNPTACGELRQSKINMSNTAAWRDGQPQIGDNTASVLANNNADIRNQGIYCLFDHSFGASTTLTDIRFMIMSFDVSSISDTSAGVELKIFGNTNSATGNPSGGTSDGIQGWLVKDNGMSSTTAVTDSDWGELYSDDGAPTLVTDNLTSWNVGTSTPNTFTINSTGRTTIEDEDLFQIAIGHKFWHDNWFGNPPFAYGNNSPNGDNDFTAIAGVYHGFGGSEAAYKPQLVIADTGDPILPTDIKIVGGNTKLNGGSLKVDNT